MYWEWWMRRESNPRPENNKTQKHNIHVLFSSLFPYAVSGQPCGERALTPPASLARKAILRSVPRWNQPHPWSRQCYADHIAVFAYAARLSAGALDLAKLRTPFTFVVPVVEVAVFYGALSRLRYALSGVSNSVESITHPCVPPRPFPNEAAFPPPFHQRTAGEAWLSLSPSRNRCHPARFRARRHKKPLDLCAWTLPSAPLGRSRCRGHPLAVSC